MLFTDSGDIKMTPSDSYFSQYDQSNWSCYNPEILVLKEMTRELFGMDICIACMVITAHFDEFSN